MPTVGIMDWDYFHYENVIPNLECAKLYTYYHNHHEIAVLTPNLEPEKYTKFFIRKEYNDGLYPKSLFSPNCEYGGRAFAPLNYSPLAPDIEKTIPNMHLYDKFTSYFGKKPTEQAQIKHILNCAHIRLSTDGVTPKTINQLTRILDTGRYTGIIFHDYNLARIDKAYDIIYDLSQTRFFKTKKGVNPYAIGNKFPIQIHSSDELQKWLKINSMPNLFCLQYNGVMTNEALMALCYENKRMARQVYYAVDEESIDEEDFIMNALPIIYPQVLFLRRQRIKILLKYNEEKIITKEVRSLLDLLNCWLSFTWQENFCPGAQTLYKFCRQDAKKHYISWAFLTVTVPTDDARDCFQFFREKNYEIFNMFYTLDSVVYKGGKFINEWD